MTNIINRKRVHHVIDSWKQAFIIFEGDVLFSIIVAEHKKKDIPLVAVSAAVFADQTMP